MSRSGTPLRATDDDPPTPEPSSAIVHAGAADVMAADASPSEPDRLLAGALALPPSKRLEIAAELWASVDEPPLSEDDDTWLAEVRARAARSHSGQSKARPWDEVKQDVLARLRSR